MVLPQKVKSTVPTPPMGQRQLRVVKSSNEQGSALTTSPAIGADAKSTLSLSRWFSTCGRRIDTLRHSRGAVGRLPRDKPSRLILPITALRETPISFAICAQDRPALTPLFSCATRSAVHGSARDRSPAPPRLASDISFPARSTFADRVRRPGFAAPFPARRCGTHLLCRRPVDRGGADLAPWLASGPVSA